MRAIENAYQKFVADSASREQVTASHILVETEDDAKAVIAALEKGERFCRIGKNQINRAKRAKWRITWHFWPWPDGASL